MWSIATVLTIELRSTVVHNKWCMIKQLQKLNWFNFHTKTWSNSDETAWICINYSTLLVFD